MSATAFLYNTTGNETVKKMAADSIVRTVMWSELPASQQRGCGCIATTPPP